MSDSDGSHSCHYMTKESEQKECDNPRPQWMWFAAHEVNRRYFIRHESCVHPAWTLELSP